MVSADRTPSAQARRMYVKTGAGKSVRNWSCSEENTSRNAKNAYIACDWSIGLVGCLLKQPFCSPTIRLQHHLPQPLWDIATSRLEEFVS